MTATAALLSPASVVATPAPAEAEGKLNLSRDDWRNLQRGLTVLGFNARGTDGKPGPATRRALAAWQEAKRLEPTSDLGPLQRELIMSEAQPKLDAAQAAAAERASIPLIDVAPATGRADAHRDAGSIFTDCPGCPEMVVIPAGYFVTGSPTNEVERGADKGPRSAS